MTVKLEDVTLGHYQFLDSWTRRTLQRDLDNGVPQHIIQRDASIAARDFRR